MDNQEKLESTKGTIKNGQSRETSNIVQTGHTKQKYNSKWVGHHFTKTNTNNVNKTWAILQITGSKDEPNIVFMCKS